MCGIFGIYSNRPFPILKPMYIGLSALGHRGQESAGITVSLEEEEPFDERRKTPEGSNAVDHLFGKIKNKINPERKFSMGIGHVRYSTAGGQRDLKNAQPLLVKTKYGPLAIAHNGNIPDAETRKGNLIKDGHSFLTDSDTEVILQLISLSKEKHLEDAILETLAEVKGAYSLVFHTKGKIITARDSFGFRPLSLAEVKYPFEGHIISSEDYSFMRIKDELPEEHYKIESSREVQPGEMIVIDENGLKSYDIPFKAPLKQCVFELIYFSEPNSNVFGHSVSHFRFETGYRFAEEFNHEIDCVVPIPESANIFTRGLIKRLNERGINAYYNPEGLKKKSGKRTFINPGEKDTAHELNPNRYFLEGKEIAVGDDSVVRGNMSVQAVKLVRKRGAKKVHFCVASPPVRGHCPYGIDIKGKEELIIHRCGGSIEEVCKEIGADTLTYTSIDILKRIAGPDFCYGCFDGEYPL